VYPHADWVTVLQVITWGGTMSRLRVVVLASAVVLAALAVPAAALAVGGTAPGAPGDNAIWTPANKVGFGTSTTTGSKVWHTLSDGKLTEV
jgi:glucoamylase